ncbi:single-stranded-DNA-specific exonuclease RecJ [Staphylococcus simiae]|uniref:single-stranded-DNA-specific exonuclease RecJ n=1 Tax=Staphylococcus simiae TaxID=308354 RepID=UPI001A97A5E1|nr:single-stranded-DNA-specific exonuclease RecJ [Staphylococcus simiae]MBO1199781.1 single-stranded-DNA-specific exonuclease RecJ [Staphylococcus simiae]MBO1202072.1 single-stranded-DNA-specific exonuclease RecJ [Staphylococcus simiae]MBO1204308.1 single-stranded-DNA-specific exonuclease RecJ [Staphylococcus simiae]MBO1211817.1 single-stranded-DNA-specific exonuclease RecJ [Staphylococcus simiae]MBO1230497.1 single-stranded-DNA-specific exonuclease RecJ [Staphylococcus simiae]
MIKSKYKWHLQQPTEYISDQVMSKYKLTPIVKKILESKSLVEESQIDAIINDRVVDYDPFKLSDMSKAVERINTAIKNKEKILVYGDYDADGVTSTTILVTTLQQLGAQVGWYIPNRFSEGYGPNELAFKNAHDEGISLIITVDNGIQGHNEIEMVQKLGVDVIVTDHHEIGNTLPSAFAIVHPMHPDFEYPFQQLCGAGVAYKLAQALLDEVPNYFKALVAIGTIADLVSLTDENRSLVKQGLAQLNDHCPVAIKALLNEAGYNDEINEETIGFIIGPRLNAVGRLEDASLACELLMTEDEEEAIFLAEQVEHFNRERKDIVAAITEEAMAMAEKQVNDGNLFLLLAKENWHEGVLGIVASKIVETYALPTLILNIDREQNHAKGSARSIAQVSMFEILNAHHDLIAKFGGHHMAAGMTMTIDNIDKLSTGLNQWMTTLQQTTSLDPVKKVDVMLDEQDITIKNIKDINKLRPFGTDFNKPLFELDDLIVGSFKAIGQGNKHLKLTLGDNKTTALYWQHGHLASELQDQQPINVLANIQINEWNGNQTPQLIIEDMAMNQQQILDYRSKRKQVPYTDNEDNMIVLIHPKSDKVNNNEYFYGEIVEGHFDKVILKDLPEKMEDLAITLNHLNFSQLYLVLQHSHSIYFEGMPHMDTFKKCYKALITKQQLNLQQDGMHLCQHLNVKPNILKFMLKVFLDLNFIVDENGIIKINNQPDKRSIDSSRIYQLRQHRMEVEQRLLYDEFTQIKEWIKSQLS